MFEFGFVLAASFILLIVGQLFVLDFRRKSWVSFFAGIVMIFTGIWGLMVVGEVLALTHAQSTSTVPYTPPVQ